MRKQPAKDDVRGGGISKLLITEGTEQEHEPSSLAGYDVPTVSSEPSSASAEQNRSDLQSHGDEQRKKPCTMPMNDAERHDLKQRASICHEGHRRANCHPAS